MTSNFKYIWLFTLLLGFLSCEEVQDIIPEEEMLPELTAGSADFSNYVAVGASFTAGFTDNGLFIAAQENSFPNTLSKQFAKIGGGEFKQPLMNDNTGGILAGGNVVRGYRFIFNPNIPGPQAVDQFLANLGAPVPPITTEATTNIGSDFNNFGIPGAKSFHLVTPGYGAFNPFYTRIASSPGATVLGDAMAQNPTFFTLSEVGGNDVLGYAIAGGDGVDQTGNLNPASYGVTDITDPNVFAQTFNAMVTTLTAGGAKGVVTNVPDITDLPHFTTVPHNPLDPTTNAELKAQITLLNTIYGALNGVYAFLESQGEIDNAAERSIIFSETATNAVVIIDENLDDISAQITGTLSANPAFPAFVQSFGLPAQAAPLVAGLLGSRYGQSRQATENDLLVLTSSTVIGTVNTTSVAGLVQFGLPQQLAGQLSAEGITFPLEDKWVITPEEQMAITMATDSYNATIAGVANSNDNIALVDLNAELKQAATTGINFDGFNLTADLVTGGAIGLDGIHLTGRGYAFMANKFLEAIDEAFGSNFIASGNIAKANSFPTNYSPTLQ
ncbi:G-D-S-L family lipolytic protein [Hyunsoonleella sp. SJ7]|uniref:G-D-S-L family lipolytic protein n=2 Tax=Hyunsoonleella aquatilis TaxID=2762758 RepID=A0A923H9U5_9FLAO|nr:G-D-S-L family lipolytic protein [Hyunsoonleella aquatilis]MBC3758314.1 G-D-S-L family lipolytic protein [Hyunsoonleella aquatilis]